ncbi:MAG: D-alanyl-D-alanine carboxypeptidase, partial [Planctomycetota bacterium]
MKKILLIALLHCVFHSSLAFADLARRINSVINSRSQQKVVFSVQVINASSGKKIYDYQGKKALIPASNMKII